MDLNSPVLDTKINEANWRFFFYCDQTTNHQDSELLPTNYFVSVCVHIRWCDCAFLNKRTCVCMLLCALDHMDKSVCKQERRVSERENMIIFV